MLELVITSGENVQVVIEAFHQNCYNIIVNNMVTSAAGLSHVTRWGTHNDFSLGSPSSTPVL